MSNIRSRLDKIKNFVESDSLYNQQSLGGELNFHIFAYEPSDELVIRDYIKTFINNYSYENSKVKPVFFDLFEMILEILDSKKIGTKSILDMAIEKESKEGTEKLVKSIIGLLKPEAFVELIKSRLKDSNLVIIAGVGKAYPLVRSHTVLNNLHAVLDKIPVIMFYPGKYDQKELRLFAGNCFDGLKDDNYYRAFKLFEN